MNHPPRHRIGLALLLCSIVVACGGDDDDGDSADPSAADDDASDDDGSDPSGNDSAPDSSDDDASTAGDDGDPTGSGGMCGPTPQICVAFVDHLVECDPANEDLADEAKQECACSVAMYPDTPACQEAVAAYFECGSTFPCDMPEACLDAGFAMASACGE